MASSSPFPPVTDRSGEAASTEVVFARLFEVAPAEIVALMNDPQVRRQLPLAKGEFTLDACARFVEGKERMWDEAGYGPWAFLVDDRFVGWGGLQPEGGDADIGLILGRDGWGLGRQIYERVLTFAFDELGLDSVIALLPPTRKRGGGLKRLGFEEDGELVIGGERFVRFRLYRPRTGLRGAAPQPMPGGRLRCR